MTASAPHKCPAPDCERMVPQSQFACGEHWRSIPAEIRSRIWSGYRSRNEDAHRQAMLDGVAYLKARAATA